MSSRILIVEDEPLIALDLERILTDAGFAVIGMASSVDKALGLLRSAACDAAVLDQNLRGETVEPVASYLQERGTPFLFVSGYSRAIVADRFAGAPLLGKPVDPLRLVGAIKDLLAR